MVTSMLPITAFGKIGQLLARRLMNHVSLKEREKKEWKEGARKEGRKEGTGRNELEKRNWKTGNNEGRKEGWKEDNTYVR